MSSQATTPSSRTPAIALTIAAFTLTACTHDDNARHTIGLDLDVTSMGQAADGKVQDDPTLFALNRAEWDTIEFMVPVDGTVHGPIFTRSTAWPDSHPRQVGTYPTAQSALERSSGEGFIDAVETIVAPVGAAVRTVQGFIDLGDTPPWSTTTSPGVRYEREQTTMTRVR